MKIIHPFEPIYNQHSKILILGTIPSIKSRENAFYYGHPQNKFWIVLSDVLNQPIPITNLEKKEFLYKQNIAVWDVLKSCEIKGSSDSSIKNSIPNDFTFILKETKIKHVFTTGKKAFNLYQKQVYPKTNISAIYLPSTSPANQARFPYIQLKKEWEILLKYL